MPDIDNYQEVLDNYSEDAINFVTKRWAKWDKARQSTLELNAEVEKHLYYADKKDLYGKLPDLYELYDALVSQFDNSLFKSPDALFNVYLPQQLPEGLEVGNVRAIKKAEILRELKNGRIIEEYSECLKESLVKQGEWILFHKWSEDYDSERVETEDEQEGFSYSFQPVLKHKGVMVDWIEPKHFVIDVSRIKNYKSSECVKIVRDYLSVDKLLEIEFYKELASQQEKELRELVDEDDEPKDYFYDNEELNEVEGDQLEILELWGDIKIKGKIYKDVVLAIAGGKYIVRFEKNPYGRCPFVFYRGIVDKKTRRGLSPLINAVGLNQKGSDVFDCTLEALRQANNPNWLAAEGQLANDKQDMRGGGKVLTWKQGRNGIQTPPQEINSYKQIPANFEINAYIEKKMENAIGITKFDIGEQLVKQQTLGQSKMMQSGASTRASREILRFSSNAVIPSIELVSVMIRDFRIGNEPDELLFIPENETKEQVGRVTPDIRHIKHEIALGSSQLILEQKARLAELMPFAQAVNALAGKPMFNAEQFWKFGAQAFEIQDPKAFMVQDEIDQFLLQFPPEQREQVKQRMVALIQQEIQQNVAIQQSGGAQVPNSTEDIQPVQQQWI